MLSTDEDRKKFGLTVFCQKKLIFGAESCACCVIYMTIIHRNRVCLPYDTVFLHCGFQLLFTCALPFLFGVSV